MRPGAEWRGRQTPPDAERGWGTKPQRGSPGAAERKRPWLGALRGEESSSAVPGGLAAPPRPAPRRAPRGPRSNNVFDRLAGRVQAIIVLSGVKRIDPGRNMRGAMGPVCQLPAPLALGSPYVSFNYRPALSPAWPPLCRLPPRLPAPLVAPDTPQLPGPTCLARHGLRRLLQLRGHHLSCPGLPVPGCQALPTQCGPDSAPLSSLGQVEVSGPSFFKMP